MHTTIRKWCEEVAWPTPGQWHSELSEDTRRDALNEFSRTTMGGVDDAPRIIVSTSGLAEGVNLPRVSHTVVVGYAWTHLKIGQIIGRSNREVGGGTGTFHYLFVEGLVGTAVRLGYLGREEAELQRKLANVDSRECLVRRISRVMDPPHFQIGCSTEAQCSICSGRGFIFGDDDDDDDGNRVEGEVMEEGEGWERRDEGMMVMTVSSSLSSGIRPFRNEDKAGHWEKEFHNSVYLGMAVNERGIHNCQYHQSGRTGHMFRAGTSGFGKGLEACGSTLTLLRGLCFICGGRGHRMRECTDRPTFRTGGVCSLCYDGEANHRMTEGDRRRVCCKLVKDYLLLGRILTGLGDGGRNGEYWAVVMGSKEEKFKVCVQVHNELVAKFRRTV